ncbi:hypothetical protein HGG75_23480 [Ochrobactrum pseudogrignonense]|nr:hypothetical protein [Brucella pseudogrignonensis]
MDGGAIRTRGVINIKIGTIGAIKVGCPDLLPLRNQSLWQSTNRFKSRNCLRGNRDNGKIAGFEKSSGTLYPIVM